MAVQVPPDAASLMAVLRVSSDPPGGTLVVGSERTPLPARLERPVGTRISASVELAGYERKPIELVFASGDHSETAALERERRRVRTSRAPPLGPEVYRRRQLYIDSESQPAAPTQ